MSLERKYINGWTDRENVVLLFQGEGGQLMKKVLQAEHIAYFRLKDFEHAAGRIVRREIEESTHVLSAHEDGEWLRVSFASGYWDATKPNKWTNRFGCWVSYREELCKAWEKKHGIKTYEADVNPARRAISDRGLHIARPRRCYLDIETDSRASFPAVKSGRARILSWAIVGEDGRQWSGLLNCDTDEDEIRLLTDMWLVLEAFDQVCAWNGDGFDFPVIKERTKALEKEHELKIVKDVRRWLYLDHMLCFKRNNIMSAESGDEKQSFKLEAIATSLLGEGKHDVDGSKTWEYWAAGGTEREKLLRYNIQDTDLLRRIEEKTGYIELFQTLCEVCNVFPDSRALKPTQQVDGYMLRLGVLKGVHFVTKWFGEDDAETKQFRGAFVMEPLGEGVIADVHVADFASLYPSIMITWNLSPETKLRIEAGLTERGPYECYSPSTGVVTDVTREGILATALLELMALRAEWNKKRALCAPGTPEAKEAERRTNAYKTAANSFYGVMGTPFARYYDKDISESTTQNGVWLIKKTMRAAESRGMKVIYGDTDSLFVTGASTDEFDAFVNWCNSDLYPRLLSELGCAVNKIKLAYEKQFEWIVFTSAKRYCGQYAHYKGKAATADSKPEVKGLEYKRGDANKIARMLQGEAIDLLTKGRERNPAVFEGMLNRYKDRVLGEELPIDLVVVTKQITKELSEYVQKKKIDGTESAALPHVQVAQILLDRGEDIAPGSRVGYVVLNAEASPMEIIPADDYTGALDRFYLWENLVYPATMRLLAAAFPRHNWEQWERVRPIKPRLKRSQATNPDQLGLFASGERATPACTVTVVDTSQLVGAAPVVVAFRKRA